MASYPSFADGQLKNYPANILQPVRELREAVVDRHELVVPNYASLPASGDFKGQLAFVESLDVTYIWNGSNWRLLSDSPIFCTVRANIVASQTTNNTLVPLNFFSGSIRSEYGISIDNSNGGFTPPITGVYAVSASIMVGAIGSSSSTQLFLSETSNLSNQITGDFTNLTSLAMLKFYDEVELTQGTSYTFGAYSAISRTFNSTSGSKMYLNRASVRKVA